MRDNIGSPLPSGLTPARPGGENHRPMAFEQSPGLNSTQPETAGLQHYPTIKELQSLTRAANVQIAVGKSAARGREVDARKERGKKGFEKIENALRMRMEEEAKAGWNEAKLDGFPDLNTALYAIKRFEEEGYKVRTVYGDYDVPELYVSWPDPDDKEAN